MKITHEITGFNMKAENIGDKFVLANYARLIFESQINEKEKEKRFNEMYVFVICGSTLSYEELLKTYKSEHGFIMEMFASDVESMSVYLYQWQYE